MTEAAAADAIRGQNVAEASLSLSLEPVGGRRASRRLLVWIALGTFIAIVWAIEIATGIAAGFAFVSTKEVVVRRRDSNAEVVRGDPPPFRARRLLAVMEQDLRTLSEEDFLRLWSDPKRWEKQSRDRAGR